MLSESDGVLESETDSVNEIEELPAELGETEGLSVAESVPDSDGVLDNDSDSEEDALNERERLSESPDVELLDRRAGDSVGVIDRVTVCEEEPLGETEDPRRLTGTEEGEEEELSEPEGVLVKATVLDSDGELLGEGEELLEELSDSDIEGLVETDSNSDEVKGRRATGLTGGC